MSDFENKDLPLPEKKEGEQKDIEAKEEFATIEEAKTFFQAAKQRMLNVNQWDKISGKASAVFRLTDASGSEVEGEPKVGYHFKIDVPGPGSPTGKGFDWVKVEAIEEETSEEKEFILIRVRPSDDPTTIKDDIAHFFSHKSTSNFLLLRENNIITAAVLGRNEVPNTKDTESWLDKIRNAIVGAGAVAGFSYPQWKSLVNGVLNKS